MSTFSSGYIARTDLAQAYRKAKADTCSEKSLNTAILFANFESNLYVNLEKLYRKLNKKVPTWPTSLDFVGGYVFMPKKLTFSAGTNETSHHFISSDPTVAWQEALRTGTPKAELRPIADFTVEMHIVSSLWVNKVGHKFDASLDDSSYGARVRRYRAAPKSHGHGEFQIDAVGTFNPYFSAYRSWRQDGMIAARKALQNDKDVVVVTMDLQSYYHSIDPNFILDPGFHKKAGVLSGPNKVSANDIEFTRQIVTAMESWARQIPGTNAEGPTGLPVGPAAARVMANCLLCDFDRQMQTKLSPIHYGRYVDDVLLVLRGTNRLNSPQKIIAHLIDRVPLLREADEGMKIEPAYAAKSRLRFNSAKLHTFHLTPVAGEDLLDTIQRRIQDVSSEWRLLPDPDELDSSPAAKVLAASRDPGDEADSFARADHLSIRRLGLSIMLRNCDALARDLPPDEWKKSRHRFYAFSEAYVLSPLRLFEQHPYFARLIGLAIACGDFDHAQNFVRAIARSLRQLEAKTEAMEGGWTGIRRHLSQSLYEGVLKAVGEDARSMNGVTSVLQAIDRISPTSWEAIDIVQLSARLRQYDLARTPLKDYLFEKAIAPPVDHSIDATYHESEEWRTEGVRDFLNLAQYDIGHLRPLMFPTRPHTPSEIAELVVSATHDVSLWRRLTRAIRGVWVSEVEPSLQPPEPLVDIPVHTQRNTLRIAVPSYKTELASWSHAANGGADLNRMRYRRLVRLVNAIVTCEDRPRYAIFPELSIPRKWIRPVANTLLKEGISLIAGVEYERLGTYVRNEAHLFLRNNALGYPSFFRLIQQKHVPAHDERDHLRSMFGVTFPPLPAGGVGKAIYDHGGFRFGVLICSELSNAEHRVVLRGNVDAVFVLCWNQDLESFEAMLDAAALDIHSYQVLVNNRLYGDSRVRSPFKERWRRDVVRIKGGLEDYVVVAELDVAELRHFQSHAEPPKDGMFKPTPEGFVLNPARRVVPIAKP